MIIMYHCLKSINLLLNQFAGSISLSNQPAYLCSMTKQTEGQQAKLKSTLVQFGQKEKKKKLQRRIVYTKVVLLPVSVVSAGPRPYGPHRTLCTGLTETDCSSGHGLVCSRSPLSEKSYAVCFEWTAFFFVCSIKTEGKVSQQVAQLLHSDSSSLFCMKFNTMFYTVFDLNGVLEVGAIFFSSKLQNRKGQNVLLLSNITHSCLFVLQN